jgi:hypothetical protein
MLALVEPATDMLIRATAVDEVNEVRAQAAAIERYARAIRLSTEAIGAAQTIARRAEIRIGELDEKRKPPGKRSSSPTDDLRQQRHENRTMAENAPTVEQVLGELAPKGKATRSAVLREIKRQRIDEAGEAARRLVDQSPIDEVLDAQRAMGVAIKGLQRMHGYGQAFSAAPLAHRVKDLCRDLGDLL